MASDTNKSFTFSKAFLKEFECSMKVYDKTLEEFRKVLNSHTTDSPDEYGVCNNAYHMRYLTPNNLSSYASYIIKAFNANLIHPNIGDMEKFTVGMIKQFLVENGCVPIEDSNIYGKQSYVTNQMTIQDLTILCENDVYSTSVCSKYDMTQRKASMKSDTDKMLNMHYDVNIKKIVNALPGLMDKTDFKMCDYSMRRLIETYIETFILFANMMNTITMSNMILYCTPYSTYTIKHQEPTPNDIKYNSLVNGDYHNECVTECCLLKTNHVMFNNKIPFNINMRDIVLQDMHPYFKDTKSALHFITTDTRSPIAILLTKYGDERIEHANPDMIMNLFVHDMRCMGCYGPNVDSEYHRLDFHTDVNWLDKIAYGNNYLNGNYRADSTGNHHFDPISTGLDTLYRMFGDCGLTSSKELANHIRIVSELMEKIIQIYQEKRIQNWEMVRDILAVLGEILTRCIIKLYDNHMTVIPASDNMPNTEIPGYMYMEYFVMEADAKPTVNVDNSNTGAKKVVQNVKAAITVTMRNFVAWIQANIIKSADKFKQAHMKSINYVNNNKELNEEIKQALGNTFTPTISNYPDYKIPANDLCVKMGIEESIKPLLDVNYNGETNINELKKKWYPKAVANIIVTESFVYEAAENGNNNTDALTNYFLYGDPNHTQTQTNAVPLDQNMWNDLIDNLTNTIPFLEKFAQTSSDDFNKAAILVNKTLQDTTTKLKSMNGDNNAEEKSKYEKLQSRCETLSKMLMDYGQNYQALCDNTINTKFYATSYTLYSDIVKKYLQQKNTAQPKTESFVNAIDGIDEIII